MRIAVIGVVALKDTAYVDDVAKTSAPSVVGTADTFVSASSTRTIS